MSIHGISGVGVYPSANDKKATEVKSSSKKVVEQTKQDNKQNTDSAAVTYNKGDTTTSNKVDMATIDKMKAQAEQKTAQLRSLVEKMMTKQGLAVNSSIDIYALLREGKIEVDPEIAKQAEADIAKDGYWGVEQTSDRLVSFAKALAGNDKSKADELMNAIEEGFQEATKAWGDELPDICKETLEATREKMEAWKNETQSAEA